MGGDDQEDRDQLVGKAEGKGERQGEEGGGRRVVFEKREEGGGWGFPYPREEGGGGGRRVGQVDRHIAHRRVCVYLQCDLHVYGSAIERVKDEHEDLSVFWIMSVLQELS